LRVTNALVHNNVGITELKKKKKKIYLWVFKKIV